jgi:RNA polymerase sigma factor (TIGR02999 family)
MRRERPDHTLQPTALVNEAWLRLIAKPVSWESRAAFLRASARIMREILVDHARARGAIKRGGDREKISLLDPMALAEFEPETLLAVDAALERLGGLDARGRQVVELRYFGGLTIEETAKVLDIAAKTVTRDWNFARAWLEKELRS